MEVAVRVAGLVDCRAGLDDEYDGVDDDQDENDGFGPAISSVFLSPEPDIPTPCHTGIPASAPHFTLSSLSP